MMMSNNKIVSKFLLILTLSGTVLSLNSCYPFLYHAPLEQGNVINPERVQELKIGMNREQVLAVMGTPMLETPLSPNSWHYVYVMRIKNKVSDQKRIDLYFSQNKLAKIDQLA